MFKINPHVPITVHTEAFMVVWDPSFAGVACCEVTD